MASLTVNELRQEIDKKGARWKVRDVNIDREVRRHGLGWEPSPEDATRRALQEADQLVKDLPHLLKRVVLPQGDALLAAAAEGAAAAATRPRTFDWRSRGVIGPVTDQRACGSCVSFATTGLTAAMAAIELGITAPDLSEADQHFNSAHGANCGGWWNSQALEEVRTRGIVPEADFPYMTAFDTPPVSTPGANPVWVAHARTVSDRWAKAVRITNVTAWSGDDRKTYLSTVGPLVCGFSVFEDFYAYDGDDAPYTHVTGDLVGGHAVLVVGYDDDAGCWIARNSWGTGFAGAASSTGGGGGYFRIAYGECNIDSEAMYGCSGVIAPAQDWGGWWRVQGGVAAANSAISGVSRSANKLDIFCVGSDQGTYTAAWQPGDTSWRGWWRVQGGVAAQGTSISAVSRSADKLDIFCVGSDHGTYTAAWQPGDTSWRGWWRVQGGVAAPNTSIAAVSRSADKLDIFCVGSDQRVYTAAWQPSDTSWRGWWGVQGGVAAPNTSVSAVSRSADKLDIFCVGTDQRVYTAAWQPGDTSWRGWWGVQGGVAAPGTSIAAVSRSANKLDIFCVGTDRYVYTAAWQPGDTTWRGWWRVGNLRVMPGTSVQAVSPRTDRLDIFAVAENGETCTATWQPGFASWRGWWRVRGGVAAPGTMVSAVVRSPDHLDAFTVGTDHGTYTAAWQA